MQHARLSPSGADRWMVCTASVPLIERLLAAGAIKERDLEGPEQVSEDEIIELGLDAYEDVVLDAGRESTSFSAEGTVMHDVRFDALFFNEDPLSYIGQIRRADGFTFELTADRLDKLVEGVDWIRESTSAPTLESKVDLSDWLPGNHGFCDAYWLDHTTLYVSDLKFGVGEPVSAEGNRQLRWYALGAWVALGKPTVDKVVLNIDQPRAGGMKFDIIDFKELMTFGDEGRRVYDRIQSGNVEFVPTTKGCRFCPVRKARGGCAAYNQWMTRMMGNALMDVSRQPTFIDPPQIPKAQRYYIVSHAAAIRAWLAKLHDDSLAAAIDGDPDPGSKAILGSAGHRYFTDEKEAEWLLVSALGAEAFKKKLIGFTEIDKLMRPGRKKEGFPNHYEKLQELIAQPEPKPKLVPANHPALAFVYSVEDDFDEQMVDDDFDEME